MMRYLIRIILLTANSLLLIAPSQAQGPNTTLTLDGSNDCIAATGSASLDITGDFTFEGWIKSDNANKPLQTVFEYFDNANSPGIFLTGSSGPAGVNWGGQKLVVNLADATGNHIYISQNSNIWTTGKWTHLAVTRTGSSVAFYINGIYQPALHDGSSDTTSTPIGPSDVLNTTGLDAYIGAHLSNTNHLEGSVDEFRLWATALDSTTIRGWMCKKVSNTHTQYGNLRAYWQMDEGTGNSTTDASGNSNTGYLTNMDPNTDWVISGAPVGDASINDYANAPYLTLTHPNGDMFSIYSITGAPKGLQIYRVDEAPNSENGMVALCSNDRYFGVFLAGGTNPGYTAEYNYTSHPLATALNETQMELYGRSDNAANAWGSLSANTNTSTNDVTATGNSGQGEFILGRNTHSTIVSNTNDNGCGSLRKAVELGNPGDAVRFEPALNGNTITLTSGQIAINKNLNIQGNGFIYTKINGNGTSRIFSIAQSDTVTLSGLGLENGTATNGGAVVSKGITTISGSYLSGNNATNGGAIFADRGKLYLNNSIIISNSADTGGAVAVLSPCEFNSSNTAYNENTATAVGGAIRLGANTTSTLSNCLINDNAAADGSGIYNAGLLSIQGATFKRNITTGMGGGILVLSTGMLGLNQCTLDSNICNGDGAGIFNFGSVNIQNSTLSRNKALFGAGAALCMAPNGNAIFSNSTISGNIGANGGGGIFSVGNSLGMTNCTVTNNSTTQGGGGVWVNSSGSTFKNTIIAGNTASYAFDVRASGVIITSQGYNIVGDTIQSAWTPAVGDILGNSTFNLANPELGPLQNNGGPTFTHAFNCSSIANNAGTNSGTPATDQRGNPRVGTRDIGAYEAQFIIPTPNLGADFGACTGETVELNLGTPSDSVNWYHINTNSFTLDTNSYLFTPNGIDTIGVQLFTADGGDCFGIDTIIVSELIPTPPTITEDSWLISSPAAEYQWLINGDSIPSATTDSLYPVESGYYQIAIIDGNGCFAVSDSVYVQAVNIETTENAAVSIYPNPSSGMVTLNSSTLLQNIELSVKDIVGRVLHTESISNLSGIHLLDISRLPQGQYILEIDGIDYRRVEKLIIQK